jgi:hypothetical protein
LDLAVQFVDPDAHIVGIGTSRLRHRAYNLLFGLGAAELTPSGRGDPLVS